MSANGELAFLDTISCALGGVIVLFFIFAALNDEGSRDAPSKPVEMASLKRIQSPLVGAEKELIPELLPVNGLADTCVLVGGGQNKSKVFRVGRQWVIVDWRNPETDARLEVGIECESASTSSFELTLPLHVPVKSTCPADTPKAKLELTRDSLGALSLSCRMA